MPAPTQVIFTYTIENKYQTPAHVESIITNIGGTGILDQDQVEQQINADMLTFNSIAVNNPDATHVEAVLVMNLPTSFTELYPDVASLNAVLGQIFKSYVELNLPAMNVEEVITYA